MAVALLLRRARPRVCVCVCVLRPRLRAILDRVHHRVVLWLCAIGVCACFVGLVRHGGWMWGGVRSAVGWDWVGCVGRRVGGQCRVQ